MARIQTIHIFVQQSTCGAGTLYIQQRNVPQPAPRLEQQVNINVLVKRAIQVCSNRPVAIIYGPPTRTPACKDIVE